MKELIKRLVETHAPSGHERPVRELLRAELASLADELFTDNLGNLVARAGQAGPGGLKILLAAHMDEIGVMVTHVDEAGFARFLPIGGVSPRTLIGGRVRFLNGAAGVIGVEKLEDLNRLPAFDQLFIDLGVSSRAACPVRVGDVAAFERPFMDLGERLVSKAMDDRISVAVLVETLRRLKEQAGGTPHTLFFVFTVQEEVGPRGAVTAAYHLEPDLALAVDVTASGDTPKGLRMEVALGKGPAIKVRDQNLISDPRVVRWMAAGAEQAGLPYQLEILERGTTDASAMQISRAGVPSGCLSIPCRYIHTPSECVDYGDVQNSVALLVELLRQPVELGE